MTTEKKATPGETSPAKGNTSPAASAPSAAPAQTKPSLVKKPKPNPAAALLLARDRERAAANQAALQKLNDNNLFYLRCPRNQHHQAIYLLEYPVGNLIHPGSWCSIEHRPGDPWVHEGVRCQECLADGDKYSWLWLKPHRMPDGQMAHALAHPYGVKKDDDGNGAAHVYRISRSDLEMRLGQTIESLFGVEEPELELAAGEKEGA